MQQDSFTHSVHQPKILSTNQACAVSQYEEQSNVDDSESAISFSEFDSMTSLVNQVESLKGHMNMP